MLNPTFALLKRGRDFLHSLSERFNLTVECKAFTQTQDPYFLLTIPVPKNSQLSFNGVRMKVIEHHFTIAQTIDKKTSNSQYHYTLYLEDNNKKKYRVHIYCNKLDIIVVEPKLFVFDVTTYESLSTISTTDMNDLLDFFLQFNNIISALREHQNKLIVEVCTKVQQVEDKLSRLRQALGTHKNDYLKLCEEQIENIEYLAALGHTQFTRDKRFYQTEMTLLTQKETSQVPEVVIAQEASTDVLDNVKEANESLDSTNKKKKKKNNKAAPQDVAKSPSELILLCTKLRAEFDSTYLVAKDKAPLEAMINATFACQEIDKFLPACQAEIFELKRSLSRRIALFFRNCDQIANGLLILMAVRANIIQISNQFIEEIIKQDNVQLLKKLLALDILAESTRYDFAGKRISLVEASVQYNSVKCFCVLMTAGFTLDYISEENSPLSALVEDNSLYFDFIKNYNLTVQARNRLKNRIVFMLQTKIETTKDIEQVKLYQARIRIIEASSKLLRFLEAKPMWKTIITDYTENNRKKMDSYLSQRLEKETLARFREALRSDPEILTTSLELIEATQELLLAMDSNVNAVTILKMLYEQSNIEVKKVDVMVTLDVEFLKKEAIARDKRNIEKIKKYTEIIKHEKPAHVMHKIRKAEAASRTHLKNQQTQLIRKAEALRAEEASLQASLSAIRESIKEAELNFRELTVQEKLDVDQVLTARNTLVIAQNQQQAETSSVESQTQDKEPCKSLRYP